MIALSDEYTTPGNVALVPQWNMMRDVRSTVNYAGNAVLDIGSWDGMWAFEAETAGASHVVATDCGGLGMLENFLFCRSVLTSRAMPFYNVQPGDLYRNLSVAFDAMGGKFDIVQHFGVLYHLRDPMLSLSQARSCLKHGGTLLLETACHASKDSVSVFNGPAGRVYADCATWWVPSLLCLKEMLRLTFFEPLDEPLFLRQTNDVSRICLRARAVRSTPPSNHYDRATGETKRERTEGYLLRRSWGHGIELD